MSDEELVDLFMFVFQSEGVKCECDREFGIIVFWLMNLDNTIYIDGGLVSFCPNSILPRHYGEHIDKIIRVMMTTIKFTLKGKANA